VKVWNLLDFTVDGLMLRAVRSDNFRADFLLEEATEYVDMIKNITLK
jgi:hypothetical protein